MTEKLAYFLESDVLGGLFEDWPAEVNLALCLDEAGGCEMLVYHKDEGRSVLRKVSSVLGRPLGQFKVVPPIEGYPTRKVMFTEEQKLLTVVAETHGLPEIASDYAINYHFAVEQGLDPMTMQPQSASPRKDESPKSAARTKVEPRTEPRAEQPEARRAETAAPKSEKPKRRLSLGAAASAARKPVEKPAPKRPVPPQPGNVPGLPPGYTLASSGGKDECLFAEAQMFGRGDHIRLVLCPDAVSIQTRPVRIAEIGFRDDFARFVVPRGALSGWRQGDPAILDMAVEHFPSALARRFLDRPLRADVTITSRGIFVAPGEEIEGWAPPEKKSSVFRRVFTPMRVAMIALVGVGALTGSVVSVLQDQGTVRSGSVQAPRAVAPANGVPAGPEVTRSEGGALDLINALARGDRRE
jgi:hypothetical protein